MTEYKLKGKRVSMGIKQCDMAEKLGITPQYLNKIEKGVADPRKDLMGKISKILKVSVQELFFQD